MPSISVLRTSICGVAGFAVVGIALYTPSAPRAQSIGSLTGMVTDTAKAPLPGVKLTVVAPTWERTAVAGPDGRYQFPGIPPGTYTVRAELAGFETVGRSGVVIETKATTTLHFTLKIGCLEFVDRVDPGIAWALRQATEIMQIRISQVRPGQRCPTEGLCVCTEYVADVIRVLKGRQREVSLTPIRFLQEDGRAGEETPYSPGQEYVAFLRWDSAVGRFLRINGPIYMFPVRDNHVEFRRTDAPGITDGMRVAEFARALQKLVSATR